MVRHGGAIFGAETGAVGAAKVLHAPLGLEKLKTAGESSVKGARQAVRSEIYKQELVDRGYPAALGLPAPPSDVEQLKRVLKSYGGSGARGLGKGLFDRVSEEVRDPGVPRDPVWVTAGSVNLAPLLAVRITQGGLNCAPLLEVWVSRGSLGRLIWDAFWMSRPERVQTLFHTTSAAMEEDIDELLKRA
ncbi:hypothetical protein B0T26DRAFT_681828 [Lasiosphaeria miniovina]|uniref:Uncharacterized protein n=1 Tax=Lasiosphaeria miniovina TaxID=1954250 RepID=A0AA39ZQH6_9PEZI|nr:uncharacterized protein B0T26DRAFT_681828 [Lasiosphaeria miniovina]KAK0701709.1 hypothetical protein B0T26DRAFT_681828 [Lasiosphaeria miniovina]